MVVEEAIRSVHFPCDLPKLGHPRLEFVDAVAVVVPTIHAVTMPAYVGEVCGYDWLRRQKWFINYCVCDAVLRQQTPSFVIAPRPMFELNGERRLFGQELQKVL